MRRVWARCGFEVVPPAEPHYQWGYTYGAMEVSGEMPSSCTPTVRGPTLGFV
jgi:hypothetical protein